MKFLEFKDKIKEIYSSKFPNSICTISLGSLGKDTAYIKWYLMKDSSEVSGGIAGNDLFRIMFILETEQEVDLLDDTELPEKITLSVHQNSITTKPTNQYMAYGSIKLPFRKTTNTPEKILSTLQKYVDITYKTLDELYDLDAIPDSFQELVAKKLNKQPKTEDKITESRENDVNKKIEQAKEWKRTLSNIKPNMENAIDLLEDLVYDIKESIKSLSEKNFAAEDLYNTMLDVLDDVDAMDAGEKTYIKSVKVNMENAIDDFINDYQQAYEEESLDETKKLQEGTDELPDYCYIYVESTKEIAVVRKYIMGYFPTDVDTSDMTTEQAYAYVDKQNEFLGVTAEQRDEMKRQSMFGWKHNK